MNTVVIASAVRTPIGNFMGGLSSLSATELGALVISEAVRRCGIAKEDVDEVIMGNVLPHGLGQNPARQALLMAELPVEVGAMTINKVCGSGLKAVMVAAHAIMAGDAEVVVAGGMESMSRAPYYLDRAREGYRLWDGKLIDAMVHDGLWDVVNDFHMGYTAELVSQKFQVSRDDQDRFAFQSNQRALKATAQGGFEAELLPVEIPQRKGASLVVDRDEGPRQPDLEAMARLKPVFKEDGTVTAGNASKISDGASALVVMSLKRAKELGVTPMAAVGAQASAGVELKDILVAPIKSIPKVLAKAGLSADRIDLFEINEAFAASTVAIIRELGLDPERVNVRGGAIAMGHPIGASGARVLTTLLYAMKDRDAKLGLASLCLGGGEAVSLIVER
ncbi:MAG: acetyl-CoA C-acetyltransferase [Deltaproteobacteria bacterium]|nr:acetyl-CoA C-acetyltransferase [Deltaproteobacteria bacterium]MBW2120934.1 acetyl-CoA C-acetyltransferase [Deltaproteobacteria bacterium]